MGFAIVLFPARISSTIGIRIKTNTAGSSHKIKNKGKGHPLLIFRLFTNASITNGSKRIMLTIAESVRFERVFSISLL
jgi:hypothetical protein